MTTFCCQTEQPLSTAISPILCVLIFVPPTGLLLHSTERFPSSPRSSVCSGLDKSLPTNYIMGLASKCITHGADRRIIAPVCHTPLAFPVKSSRDGRLRDGGVWELAPHHRLRSSVVRFFSFLFSSFMTGAVIGGKSGSLWRNVREGNVIRPLPDFN